MTKAIEDALNSPLLNNTDVFSSKHLLFNLCYSREAEDRFKAVEAREFNDFVSKIDPQVEVIWGIKYDETLGNKVKLTVLASGFDVTITENDKHEPEMVLTSARAGAAAPVEAAPIDMKKIGDIYGEEKIGETVRTQDRQRYIILEDDHLDNDEMIERFEKTPAFNRDRRLAMNLKAAPAPAPAQAEHRPEPARNDDPNRINFIDE